LGKRQKAGGRRQEAGGRWREAGGRRQVAGGGRQEAGGRRQVAGGRSQGCKPIFHFSFVIEEPVKTRKLVSGRGQAKRAPAQLSSPVKLK